MKIKIKVPTKKNPDEPILKLLRELKKAKDELARLRTKHEKVFEELDDAAHVVTNTTEAVRRIAKDRVDAFGAKAGSRILLKGEGSVLRVQGARIYDAEALVQRVPKVAKVGGLKYTISDKEIQRLLLSGVVTQKDVDAVTTYRSSLYIEDDKNFGDDDG